MIQHPLFRFPWMALAGLCLLAGCGQKEGGQSLAGEGLAEATKALNDRDYAGALRALESVPERASPEVARKRMHAHAGASGFEAVKFKMQVEAMEKRIDAGPSTPPAELFQLFSRDKNERPKFNLNTMWNFRLYRSTEQLKEILQDAPALDASAKGHLDQAISIYAAQGWKPAKADPEDNFRWGVLYGYRASARLSELSRKLDEMAKTEDVCRGRVLQAQSAELLVLVSSDIFAVFQMFKHSYSKVRKIAVKLGGSLEKVSDGYLSSVMLQTPDTREAFLRQFFYSNYSGVSDALAMRWLAVGGLKGMFTECPKADGAGSEEQMKARYRQDRGRATTRLFTNDYLAKGEKATYYTPAFFTELGEASSQVDSHNDAAPLDELSGRAGSQSERLGRIVRLVAEEVPPAEADPSLRPYLEHLAANVNKEQAKLLEDDLSRVQKEAAAVGATVDGSEEQYASFARKRLSLLADPPAPASP